MRIEYLQADSENHPHVWSFIHVFSICLSLNPRRPLLNKSKAARCPGGSVGRGVQPVAATWAFPDPVSLAGNGMPTPRSRPTYHVALAIPAEAASTAVDRLIVANLVANLVVTT